MPLSSPLALGIDIGTTSIKIGVFDSSLQNISSLSCPVRVQRKDDRAEIHAEKIYQDFFQLLEKIYDQLGSNQKRVCGMGLSSQRSTFVFWNSKEVLGPALTWQDVRTSSLLSNLKKWEPTLQKKTGLRLSPHYSASKIQWALENWRDLKTSFQKKDLFVGPLSTFLVWKLTQGKIFAVDPTQAQRMLLLNLKTLSWDPEICEWFSIPMGILPKILPSQSHFGEARIKNKTIPILATLGDTQASCYALGLNSKNPLTIQYGTGAFVSFFQGKKIHPCPGLLTSLYVSKKNEKTYFLEGTINSAGSFLDWISQKPSMDALDAPLFPSALIPSLQGLGAPHWISQAKPIRVGQAIPSDQIKQKAMEGIGYRTREILEIAKTFGCKIPSKILVSGGLAENKDFLQTQANILQKTLCPICGEIGSAAGAAALALSKTSPVHPTPHFIHPKTSSSFLSNPQWSRAMFLLKTKIQRPNFEKTLWFQKWKEFRPLFFAHRGASHLAPENTLSAFDLAAQHHADGIELDVHLTKDGIPIVLHDGQLQRTTNGKGRVEDLLLKEIRSFSAGKNFPSYSQEKIPTLEEVFLKLPPQILLYIEMKDKLGNFSLWEKALACVQEKEAFSRVAFCSFNLSQAKRFKEFYPHLLVGGIVDYSNGSEFRKGGGFEELDLLSFHKRFLSPVLVQQCLLQNQMILSWTIDDEKTLQKALDIGADGIVTNRIEKYNVSLYKK